MSSFVQTNSPRPQISSFTDINNSGKKQMLTFKKLEATNVYTHAWKITNPSIYLSLQL